MNLDAMWTSNRSHLIKFFHDAERMSIETRLKSFRDIFPFSELLPVSLYLYDLKDRVIACNEVTSVSLGDKCITDYIDHPLDEYGDRKKWPKKITDIWTHNNHIAIQSGIVYCQESSMEAGCEKFWSSRKDAIYNSDGQPVGVVGLTVPIALKSESIHWDSLTNKVTIKLFEKKSIEFSAREFTMLQGLLNGGTAQEIATVENISAKTVETYIMRIKSKLSCQKQRDIITLLIQTELANEIMRFRRV